MVSLFSQQLKTLGPVKGSGAGSRESAGSPDMLFGNTSGAYVLSSMSWGSCQKHFPPDAASIVSLRLGQTDPTPCKQVESAVCWSKGKKELPKEQKQKGGVKSGIVKQGFASLPGWFGFET